MQQTTFTVEQIRAAHSKAKGDVENMFAFLEGRRPGNPMEWVNTLALACEAGGVQLTDYSKPENGTSKEKADAYWKRLMLYERVFNRPDWKPDIADTKQRKHSAYANVIKDEEAPFGFRLSFGGYDCDDGCSALGARPEFERQENAVYVFKTFTSDYEGYLHYMYLSKQQNQ